MTFEFFVDQGLVELFSISNTPTEPHLCAFTSSKNKKVAEHYLVRITLPDLWELDGDEVSNH